MPATLCVLSCHSIEPEARAAIAAEGWTDVVAAGFPARGGRPPIGWDELRPLLPAGCSQVVVLGSDCLQDLPPPADFPPVRTEPTGLDSQAAARLAAFPPVVGLPARRLGAGLDPARMLLKTLVLQWRLERAEQRARDQATDQADRVAVMDMLRRLTQAQTEEEAIDAIEELFEMLFAPAALHYVRLEGERAVPKSPIPDELLQALQGLTGGHAWTPDEQGFLLRLAHAGEPLGLLAVDRLAFPQARHRYLNLALAMADVCALAIENARNRRRLVEAQTLAALGSMVAGVAHEINTPLGVGIAAASSLQGEAELLAQKFAARSLTQADLTQGLEIAATSTDLIRRNLERIGRLVDAFRRVALDHQAPASTAFGLRACLDDVVTSLGSRIDPECVALHIDCDPALQLVGVRDDWVSIFSNLIGNSLLHGFAGRERGAIDIRIARDARQRLQVDYRDDGVGMAPDTVARVFEPFFTTDLTQGVGLGMPLVYNLVTQRMQGRITCTSTPGQGAHFHLELPAQTVDAPPAAQPS